MMVLIGPFRKSSEGYHANKTWEFQPCWTGGRASVRYDAGSPNLLPGVTTRPSRPQAGPVDLRPAKIYGGYSPRICDVVERISVEHNEVCALARRYGAGVSNFQELCRVASCCDDDLRRRHPGRHHVSHL